ncbi:PIN domain-containing protein [Paenibacillus koleovorans]|uniref:PIN domain-containing protein n=1 Tax=Paenibacillus koleovorans TaxID=121608 RepID=UPI000FDA68CD|nr:PIN domain-containing protein [Paenibacillus koleovorans]
MNVLVDTNVIVRLLVQDDLKQLGELVNLLDTGKINLVVTPFVVIESCWVLKSRYQIPSSAIAKALLAFLQSDEVMNEDSYIEEALERFAEKNVDILDAYLSVRSKSLKIPVLTWDKDFRKLDCEFYTPTELN